VAAYLELIKDSIPRLVQYLVGFNLHFNSITLFI
jgi:hypothetical protein